MRATTRLVDCSFNTVAKLLIEAGRACTKFQDKALRNLPCKRLQVDEVWGFVGAKDLSTAPKKRKRRDGVRHGFGRRFAPILSCSRRGSSGRVFLNRRIICFTICANASLPTTMFRSRPTVSRCISRRCIRRFWDKPISRSYKKFMAQSRHHQVATVRRNAWEHVAPLFLAIQT